MGHSAKFEMHYNLENVNIFTRISFKYILIQITEVGFVCFSKCIAVKKKKESRLGYSSKRMEFLGVTFRP
jgi:hypothetical protein